MYHEVDAEQEVQDGDHDDGSQGYPAEMEAADSFNQEVGVYADDNHAEQCCHDSVSPAIRK